MFTINLTFVGQIFAFALFVWACMVWIWPPITNAISDRQKKIQEALRKASDAQRGGAEIEKQNKQILMNAQRQAQQTIESARNSANQTILDAKHQAEDEAKDIIKRAKVAVEQEREKLKSELAGEVAKLVEETINKLIGDKSLDSKKIDKTFIENRVKQI